LGPIDHLVYGTPDLETAVSDLAARLGVAAVPGGSHPGRGTRNALVGLGPGSYLEILGPDPGQPAPKTPRWFTIDELRAPRLVGWSVRRADLETCAAAAAAAGLPLGAIGSGSRKLPGGQVLRWRFTDPAVRAADGVVPFFMDWGAGPHPADGLRHEVRLAELRLEHPDPGPGALLRRLALGVEVRPGPLPRISALLETPRGLVEL
jgi:hypothetical protein